MSQMHPAVRTPSLWTVRPDAADTIRDARKANGLTQTDLGCMLGAPLASAQGVISRLERGDLRIEVVIQAAAILGLEIDDVLERQPVKPPGFPFA